MDAPVISAAGVRKRYGDVDALRGVDLAVAAGEVLAILGPNGAGKTTLVEILEGHRARNGGEIMVLGTDPGRAGPGFRDRIGIVLQSSGIPKLLICAETLRWQATAYSRPAGRASCSPWWTSPTRPTPGWARCRAASCGASTSPSG